ncbi:LLM class flavin-dependent oxidoreductase [Pseudonocardia parietis]|uniref:Alkanesulfonate monooxygenase SsuD/methylene tetrahydromethanopterin reductase-like flavin-dependent oxidoreductase (Luciferase family) n=1 Tax=Pseudonocardia parietis TaxID=570936 RepID=A0ABS4VRH1_9PSEU|nr:LLM class flavin-dependent oxidoreductase [Pseudonocardia parietis]MBP2366517.1 alkanesulfonate monooxygenase SsuD/methylene tetrahydromethanopterin reductase-like flavin-dependent oxidoreductase (luciferase family) [Pseudonocardia parietis]
MTVRVGLYYDLRNPGGARSWPAVYADALRRIADAEAAGADAVWLTEHHGFTDGYLPAPLTFAAAVAARTSRVRIGTAVVVAPFVPVQALAEQAAVVDILSGGRLELGLGAGWREAEFAAFGAAHGDRYAVLERVVTELGGRSAGGARIGTDRSAGGARTGPDLWSTGAATPPPVQDPLPLWVGARGPRGARIAGRTGAGLLWLDHELYRTYRDAFTGPGLPRVGGLVNLFLADDPDSALARIRPLARHNRATYAGNDRGAARGPAVLPKLQVVTPQQAAAVVRERTAGLPATDVFCFGDIGGLDADLVDRHVELVAGTLPRLLREPGPTAAGPG